MTVERKARWDDEWPAWSGDKERLGRLAYTMDGLIEQRREQATEEAVKSALDELEEAPDGLSASEYRRIARDMVKTRTERAKQRWMTEMMVTEREMWLTLQGEPGEVIEAIDPPFVERLEMQAPASPTAPVRAVIRMSKAEGCSLEVQGSDPAWVSSARDALSSEIRRAVPWWGWLRSARSWVLYFFVAIPIAIALVLLLAVLLSGSGESQASQNTPAFLGWLAVAAVIGIPSALIASGIHSLARRSLPGFEITPAGSTPRAIRALAFIGGLVLSFLLSIGANLVTARIIN